MQAVVAAMEAAAALPAYQAAALAWAPDIAAHDFGPHGAFMGYDFHAGDDGPKLIEINTNAGGAFLNQALGRAQSACCPAVERALARESLDRFEDAVVAMFEAEWRSQRASGELRRIAIVDDAPETQYLHPEFVIAKKLFERHGYEALIADGRALSFERGILRAEGRPIDLVYNRLVDFALADPAHAPLRAAYLERAAVLTPNPRHHALYADKRNLTLLSDTASMAELGLAPEHAPALRAVPGAMLVTPDNAADLWAARKRYFFKPASGYGSKAVYRGDKLTKAVWEAIAGGDYIAQEFAPPSERTVRIGEELATRKLDVRLYTYRGEVLLAAARLYQGQTTNFRTQGGGFAPVFFL
ncbi:MAG: hypothetical protein BroJett013_24980 [Alphaproteobacteria bacterium]|nr:MAG: hypothetical protein BroJett013_24980 [Alphaproteobacteria bacterium]